MSGTQFASLLSKESELLDRLLILAQGITEARERTLTAIQSVDTKDTNEIERALSKSTQMVDTSKSNDMTVIKPKHAVKVDQEVYAKAVEFLLADKQVQSYILEMEHVCTEMAKWVDATKRSENEAIRLWEEKCEMERSAREFAWKRFEGSDLDSSEFPLQMPMFGARPRLASQDSKGIYQHEKQYVPQETTHVNLQSRPTEVTDRPRATHFPQNPVLTPGMNETMGVVSHLNLSGTTFASDWDDVQDENEFIEDKISWDDPKLQVVFSGSAIQALSQEKSIGKRDDPTHFNSKSSLNDQSSSCESESRGILEISLTEILEQSKRELDFQALQNDYLCIYSRDKRSGLTNDLRQPDNPADRRTMIQIAAGEYFRESLAVLNRWKFEKDVAQGGFSRVILAEETVEPFRCAAIKITQKNTDNYDEIRMCKELFIMRVIGLAGGHPNIVQLFEATEDSENVYIIMECLKGGDLFGQLAEQRYYTEEVAADKIRGVIDALAFCHRLNIAHRDVKPENIVYERKEEGTLKLVDFGVAFYSEEPDAVTKTITGTPHYIAPEVLLCSEYIGAEADVWSIGVLTYILLSGEPPFDHEDLRTLVRKIKYEPVTFEGSAWVAVSEPAKHFISRMLDKDPASRMTMMEALSHPWLSDRINLNKKDLLMNVQDNIRAFQRRLYWRKGINAVMARNRMLNGITLEAAARESKDDSSAEVRSDDAHVEQEGGRLSRPRTWKSAQSESPRKAFREAMNSFMIENRAKQMRIQLEASGTMKVKDSEYVTRTKGNPNALKFPANPRKTQNTVVEQQQKKTHVQYAQAHSSAANTAANGSHHVQKTSPNLQHQQPAGTVANHSKVQKLSPSLGLNTWSPSFLSQKNSGSGIGMKGSNSSLKAKSHEIISEIDNNARSTGQNSGTSTKVRSSIDLVGREIPIDSASRSRGSSTAVRIPTRVQLSTNPAEVQEVPKVGKHGNDAQRTESMPADSRASRPAFGHSSSRKHLRKSTHEDDDVRGFFRRSIDAQRPGGERRSIDIIIHPLREVNREKGSLGTAAPMRASRKSSGLGLGESIKNGVASLFGKSNERSTESSDQKAMSDGTTTATTGNAQKSRFSRIASDHIGTKHSK
eukprot:CAMPEP_0182445120 /NCGR_PEP_ID=MMETSP1172-20130603/3357_1 /TAXON_ID=708627 /ORGANISM="Timspurckia oligopyrenoides, Strain CCMP3278" /LENGTH=1113 /DNA_ID=CAMNT_0024640829 /DNA_START=201 /DNA_END=3542 /DNA_ORIENTATION=+